MRSGIIAVRHTQDLVWARSVDEALCLKRGSPVFTHLLGLLPGEAAGEVQETFALEQVEQAHHHRLGNFSFAQERQGFLCAAGMQEGDPVGIDRKPGIGRRDVIGNDQIQMLCLELVPGIF